MSGQSNSSSTSGNFIRRLFQRARRGVGSCFSVGPSSPAVAGTAGRPRITTVIKPDGSLMEYYLPIRVRYVLLTTQCLSSVVCDADELSYGRHVQALDSDHLLRPGNIYFVLPKKCLKYPLTAAEMAALASRANGAFAKAASLEKKKKKIRGSRGSAWKGVRILPVAVAAQDSDGYERMNEDCVFCGGSGAGVPIAEVLDAWKTPIEDFVDGDEELENLLKEMAERNKRQNFYKRKKYSPTLSAIPEDNKISV
ncbi:hypothetical protein KSP40_PGU002023 [Platanthera guangdongensis]|uniref:Uncharacterized protein n=1 Tax=Platanthera guangdongensis TaxID=2320717 RepID=A0ABR2N238_9ASPA